MQHKTSVTSDGGQYIHNLVQGDRQPYLSVPLYIGGERVNPSEYSRHKFVMKDEDTVILERGAQIVDDMLVHVWNETDTGILPGTYTGRFHVYDGRERVSFPNSRRGIVIHVTES